MEITQTYGIAGNRSLLFA